MNAKLVLTRPAESFGEAGHRTRIASAELVGEFSSGYLVLSIKRGVVHGDDHEIKEPEQVAAMPLNQEERLALIAFLSSLPQED